MKSVKGRGEWVKTPTHVIDLMATCVDLGGASYPKEFGGHDIHPLAGVSLRPFLQGSGEFPERPLFWEHEGNAAIRLGDYKLVREGLNGDWELFDLKSDRTEQNNLAGDQPNRVNDMLRQWRSWARTVNAMPKPNSQKKQ